MKRLTFGPSFILRRYGTTFVCITSLLTCLTLFVNDGYNHIRTQDGSALVNQPRIMVDGIPYSFTPVRDVERQEGPNMNHQVIRYEYDNNSYIQRMLADRNISTRTSLQAKGTRQKEDQFHATTSEAKQWERLPPMIVNSGSPHQPAEEEEVTEKGMRNEEMNEDKERPIILKSDEVDDVEPHEEEGEEEEEEEEGQACNDQVVLPSGGFCLHKDHVFINDNKIWDGMLCRGLEDLFGRSTVLDLGAGLGHYGRCFYRMKYNVIDARDPNEREYLWHNYWYEMGIGELRTEKRIIKSWTGYDGAQNIAWVSGDFVKELDLTEPITLNRKYDWVMSLEVGEHLPRDFQDVFLDNLLKCACKGIVLSWSPSVAEDHNHINPQPNSYIIKRMKERGLIHDQKSQKILRDTLRLEHFKISMMVFRVPKERQC